MYLRLKYLGRAWPAWIIVALGSVHFLLIVEFGLDRQCTNKTVALLTQLLGGAAILYTIDSNIGIFAKKNLRAIFAKYLREWPGKRTIYLETAGSSARISSAVGKVSFTRNPTSIEEKIAYLQEQINWVKEELKLETNGIKEKIDRQSKEFRTEIQKTKSALQDIESKMVKVSTGGLKLQIFGIFLMVYGAFSGYFA
jgi:hypothetical protein